MSQHFNHVLESIDHQTKARFNKLVDAVAQPVVADREKAIAKFILDEIGIKSAVKVIDDDFTLDAYVSILPISTQNAFYNDYFMSLLEQASVDDLLEDSYIDVFIDLKNAKIKFKETKEDRFNIGIASAFFTSNNFTNEEIAAVILHEVGHIFNTLVQTLNMSITNQIVKDIVAERYSDRTLKYRVMQDTTDLKEEDLAISVLSDKTDVVRKSLNTKYYDNRLNESMADHFVARHGGGIHLATALSKDGLFLSNDDNRPQLGVISLVVFASMAAIFPVTGAAAIVFGTGMLTAMGRDTRYDNLYDRLTAIRRQTVSLLSKKDLDKEYKKEALNHIAQFDKILKTIPKNILNTGLFAPSVLFFDYMSGKKNNLNLHKKIENFVNNDLFIAGSQFSVLNEGA